MFALRGAFMDNFKTDDKTKILVVDDDIEILDLIKEDLSSVGYSVIVCSNGVEAINIIENNKIDLVVMDVMMPQMNGIIATIKIREKNNMPILMLSAKSETSDKVIGLSSGADDYLSKPFFKDELLARTEALLRRYMRLGSSESYSESTYEYFDLKLFVDTHKFFVRGQEVSLTNTEYKIIELLIRNPGRVFTAEQLYRQCRSGEAFAIENTIMIHISRIRKKIEINPLKPDYIKVVWGVGYKIEKK